jgi:RNA recognition motif-containing protein
VSASAPGGYGAGDARAGEKRKVIRTSAGETWEDPSLAEWPENDFRLFAGDLGHDVTDEMLAAPFRRFPSFAKAKMIRDKNKQGKTKGFGFVSFLDPYDGLAAMKEITGQHIGLRPVKLTRSSWQERSIGVVRAKEKEARERGY